MPLRPYQQAAHNATIQFIKNESGHGVMCAAGGAGKSHLIAGTAEHLRDNVLVLADRAKLIKQNFSKFEDQSRVGIVSAGLGSSDFTRPITIGGIQTIYNKAGQLGDIKWIIVDECEAIGNNFDSDSRYHQLLRRFPEARILGYTATPFTLKEGQVSWGKIYHEIGYEDLVKWKYLTPVTNKVSDIPDLSGVPKSGKEYNQIELEKIMREDAKVAKAAKKTAEYITKYNRKKGLGFCVGIEHAARMDMALRTCGVECRVIWGGMREEERAEIYEEFECDDNIHMLLNVEILTTGIDFPFLDYICCFRPTESLRLWHQMLYRGTRLCSERNKTECILFDYSGNLKEFGGLANPMWKYMGTKKVKAGKSMKICPACEEAVNYGRESCPACDYIFEKSEVIREVNHETEADLNSDINRRDNEKYVTVKNILYYEHTSKAGNQLLRVEYVYGNKQQSVSEYPPFGNKAKWATGKCLEFIKPRARVMPESIEEALELCKDWKKPKVLKIRKQKSNPKYWEPAGVEKWEDE